MENKPLWLRINDTIIDLSKIAFIQCACSEGENGEMLYFIGFNFAHDPNNVLKFNCKDENDVKNVFNSLSKSLGVPPTTEQPTEVDSKADGITDK